ncbi:MAG: DNA polymerase subunit beta [Alphaproteobacteria bacterium CG_4_10_14_0_2_um_filter_63_37]|nr:MAG: DNA polymerase subunit beta [Proteobacteria bacterium CG1_02_64_396]PJA24181.1 MAG: DNA polymerase subunit beta [Alphaproteobacteria bacterium CG_4_10_14_0_2_um_filter_63_37]
MNKSEALRFFEEHRQVLVGRFGIKRLALFGSVVRDQADKDSDLDVLVEFEPGNPYRRYFDLLFYLEDQLHCPIDLVCADAVRPQILPYIEKEALYVA